MQFSNPFDARQVDPSPFPPVPPLADYHVMIVESEGKPTNSGKNGYLELTLEILDQGPFLKRHIPYRLNLFNDNAQTVDIAYKQLSAVCHVTGQFGIQDSRQLHNLPFVATIGPQTNNPQYANVFAVKDVNGVTPGKPGATQFAAPPPAAPAPPAAAPSWAPQPAAPAPAAPVGWSPTPAAPPVAAPPQQWQPVPAAAPPAAAPPLATWPGATPPAAPPAAAPWAQGPPTGKAPWEK